MSLANDVIEKIAALLTAAFGLVAALAWNSAIQEIFNVYFPNDTSAIAPMVTYAIVVTVIAVIVAVAIGAISAKAKKASEKVAEKAHCVVEKVKKE
ncbi:MAG TPA: DUF5654 family protein [Methanocorpusculum sp.]|nr:DUF5654 family protein [Methanocorpusculum sp.]